MLSLEMSKHGSIWLDFFLNHISRVNCSVGKTMFILRLGLLFVLVCARTIRVFEDSFVVISTSKQ